MGPSAEKDVPRRPLRTRVWFWKPSWYWHGWKTLIPFFTGGDEFDWHTVCIGWTITGRIIIATRPCPRTGKCADVEGLASWPVDGYGLDWSNGRPTAEDYEAAWVEVERPTRDIPPDVSNPTPAPLNTNETRED